MFLSLTLKTLLSTSNNNNNKNKNTPAVTGPQTKITVNKQPWSDSVQPGQSAVVWWCGGVVLWWCGGIVGCSGAVRCAVWCGVVRCVVLWWCGA